MYARSDIKFMATGSDAEVARTKEGSYVNERTEQSYATATEWMRATKGPYGIVCASEEIANPVVEIQRCVQRARKANSMSGRFMFAEETFATVREIPALLVLFKSEVYEPIKALALEFLLYDDIAAHPVWLYSAQEAMRLTQKVDTGEV